MQVFVFLIAEILPIVFSLKPHIIQSLSEDYFNPNFEHYLGFGGIFGGSKSSNLSNSQGADSGDHTTRLLDASSDAPSGYNKPRTHTHSTHSTQSLTPSSSTHTSPNNAHGITPNFIRNPMTPRDPFSPTPVSYPIPNHSQERGGNNSRDSTIGDEEEYRDARQHSSLSSSFGERSSFVTADSSHSERPNQGGEGFWKNLLGFWS